MAAEIRRPDAGSPSSAGRAARVAEPVVVLLAVAVGASGALLLALGSKLTFLLDDWEFLLYRPGFTAHSILAPHNEHIVVAPILIYKALLATFGMSSALPFRAVSTALFLVGAVLLFHYLRRRVGDWLALLGACVILFLGPAFGDLLWPFQIGFMGSIACGLGMLLALEREDQRGDRIACLLLVVCVAFSSLALAFAAGAAVAIALGPGSRRKRAYVVATPLLLYAIWWIGWGHTGDSAFSLTNVAHAPSFVFDGVAASLASVLGVASTSFGTTGGLEWGRPLLLVALVLAGRRLYRLGRVPRSLWIVLAVAGTFWILAGLNYTVGRSPVASRYQLPGAIFVLMAAAELLRGVRVSRVALLGAFAAGAVVLAANVSALHAGYLEDKAASDLERADLGAVEIARNSVSPAFVLSHGVAGTSFVHVNADLYLAAADRYGSPADSPAEIAAAPDEARAAADRVLAKALGVAFEPVARAPGASGPAPSLVTPPTPSDTRSGSCVTVSSAAGEPAVVSLPRGGVIVHASRSSGAIIALRRFATDFFAPARAGLQPGTTGVLRIPTDSAPEPWQLEVDATGPTTICGGVGAG